MARGRKEGLEQGGPNLSAGGSPAARPREPAASAGRARRTQILNLVGIAASAFVCLSLGSWSPSDSSFSVTNSAPVALNFGGPVGAYTADFLYQAFGWSSWSVLVVGAWLVMRLAGRASNSLWNVLLGGVTVWMLATALELGLGHEGARAFPPGGLMGVLTGEALVSVVGLAGGVIGVATVLLATLTTLFGINWQPLALATVEGVRKGTPKVGRLLGAATLAAGRGAAAAGSRAGSAVRARFESDDVDDEPEGVLNESPDLRSTVGGPSVAPAGSTRARHALEDRVETVGDLPSVHGSVWSAAAAPAPRSRFDSPIVDKATHVSPRTLVEVEVDRESVVPRGTQRAAAERAAAYDIPPARIAPTDSAPVFVDDDLDAVDDVGAAPPVHTFGPTPSSNAFGMSFEADPPRLASPVGLSPLPTPLAESVPRGPRAKRQPEVVPGLLGSGGIHDDGSAVRQTNHPFQLPPLSLLDEHPAIVAAADESRLHDLATRLTLKLKDFGVEGRVSAIRPGPVITMFEYEPAPGIKLSKIASLSDDVAMAIKALAVRIVAPLPGRGVVGFEVPNDVRHTVWARDVFSSAEFRDQRHTLPIMLGKDTEGRPYVADLAKTPHLLVGGTTGSGKSVGINAMLVSLLMTKTPEELRLILIDPKMLEFELYKEIPHLLHPVVTDASLASKVLAWACEEMDRRYRMLGDWKVRNIENFNGKVEAESVDWTPEKARSYFPDWPAGQLIPTPKKLPYIVVVIDELADLMMVASKDVEMSIARIAQKARASGIHLIVATQRPSADVITGLIRSNMPSRLAYQVRTAMESRIILDAMGANSLLGKGDLLFVPPGVSSLTRIHGPFLSDEEVKRVADMCRAQGKPNYAPAIRLDEGDADGELDEMDELNEEMSRYYDEIVELALEKRQISTSMIQRHLKLGYNRACLLMEQLERNGIVGPADGAKPRRVLAQE